MQWKRLLIAAALMLPATVYAGGLGGAGLRGGSGTQTLCSGCKLDFVAGGLIEVADGQSLVVQNESASAFLTCSAASCTVHGGSLVTGGNLTLQAGSSQDVYFRASSGERFFMDTSELRLDLEDLDDISLGTGITGASKSTILTMKATDSGSSDQSIVATATAPTTDDGLLTWDGNMKFDGVIATNDAKSFIIEPDFTADVGTLTAAQITNNSSPTALGVGNARVLLELAPENNGSDNAVSFSTALSITNPGTASGGVETGIDIGDAYEAQIKMQGAASIGTCTTGGEGSLKVLAYSDTNNDTRLCLCGIDDTDDSAKWMNLASGTWGDSTTCGAD